MSMHLVYNILFYYFPSAFEIEKKEKEKEKREFTLVARLFQVLDRETRTFFINIYIFFDDPYFYFGFLKRKKLSCELRKFPFYCHCIVLI